MELDHLFVFVEPDGGQLRARLKQAGLTETYQRAHPGQGTANVCYAFDNAFLELLWLTDEREARSPTIARTGLADRAQWRAAHTSPFGIAWRLGDHNTQPVPTWDFKPPYLPPGMVIPMAHSSQDPQQPLLFCSPGKHPPTRWPPQRRRGLQRAAGYTQIEALRLHHGPSPDLEALARAAWFSLAPPQPTPRVELVLKKEEGQRQLLRLPEGTIRNAP